MNEQDFAELSVGYALNALSPDDRAAFEAAWAEHPEWSVHVETDAAAAALLAQNVVEVAPPLTMRSALLSKIATTPQGTDAAPAVTADADSPIAAEVAAPVAADPAAPQNATAPAPPNELAPEDDPFAEPAPAVPAAPEPAPTTTAIQAVARRNWTRSLLALAASLVILVTLGFGAASVWQVVNRAPATVALEQIDAAPDAQVADAVLADGGTVAAHWSESVGKVVLVSEGLPTLASDQTFEMWFVRADGTPVSAGTFDASGSGPTSSLLDGSVEPGDMIAVSIEPEGGSPVGMPTSDPIVAIPTA